MTAIPSVVQLAYGDLPEGWDIQKLKFFATIRTSNVDKTISEDEILVELCNYTDVYYNDRIVPRMEFMRGSATAAEIQKFQLQSGQVIITKDSEGWDDIGIPALVTDDLPGVLCGYHLAVLDPIDKLDGNYLSWLCRSAPLNNQFKTAANGVTRFGLGQSAIKNAYIALPPIQVQRRIAAFLDEKTARIDALIEKKRALLDRLAEKRQALITRLITKGLDSASLMRDSGLDWIGQVPAHWKIKRFRFTARLISGATPTTTASEYWDGDIPWISPKDMKCDEIFSSQKKVTQHAIDDYGLRVHRIDHAVIVTRGMILARKVPVSVARGAYTINQDMKAIASKGDVLPEFFQMYLSAIESFLFTLVAEAGHGTKALRTDVLSDVPVVIPPIDEQRLIVDRIDQHKNQIAKASGRLKKSIKYLREYRSAIITAAVTGQIESLS